jgi:hypothetical protein
VRSAKKNTEVLNFFRKKEMNKLNLKTVMSAVSLFSMLLIATSVKAAPVRFEQVVQVVNAKPGKANTGGFTKLRVAGDDDVVVSTNKGDEDGDPPVQQQERMITETTYEVVEDEACNCDPIPSGDVAKGGKFPYWTILAAAGAIPVAVVLLRKKDKTTATSGIDSTPTPTPTGTATPTPTVTPTMTPTPTEPVPEPMTLLLFGTGLAGIGVAARRRLRKSEDGVEVED